MKHLRSGLRLITFIMLLAASALGAPPPTFINGSFELQGDAPLPPGTMVPVGWATVGNVGINPVIPGFEAVPIIGGRNPFANNGLVPEGTHVAFIEGTPFNGSKAGLFQVFSGLDFDPTKTYVLQYYVNVRATYGRRATMIVVFGAHNLLNWHRVDPVEGLDQHTKPYIRKISIEFQTNSTAPLLLRVSGASEEANPYLVAGAPRNDAGDYRYDCTMLVDDFRWIELGPTKLLSARRSFTDRTQVTVNFSEELPESSVTNLINYTIAGVDVISAKRGVNAKQVILTTTKIDDALSPQLRVRGVIDKNGLGMFQKDSTITIDITPRNPAEFGISFQGAEDDFKGATRDPNWKVHGRPGSDVYQQSFGVLKVHTALGMGNQLLYEAPDYAGSIQEVLAKVRVVGMAEVGRGGIVASSQGDSTQGIEYLFVSEGSGNKTKLKDLGHQTESPSEGSWDPGKWYWIRLQYGTGADGKPLANSRMWLADQETMEPTLWQSLPANSNPSSGFAGIAAGQNGVQSEFEIDYILIKAEGLPFIAPQLPTGPEPYLEITRLEAGTRLRWPTEGSGNFILQTAADLSTLPVQWDQADVTGLQIEADYKTLSLPDTEPFRFYRLALPGF